MKKPSAQTDDRQGVIRDACACRTKDRRQAMDMSAYEIIMICLTAITLLLKLLKTFKSNKHK